MMMKQQISSQSSLWCKSITIFCTGADPITTHSTENIKPTLFSSCTSFCDPIQQVELQARCRRQHKKIGQQRHQIWVRERNAFSGTQLAYCSDAGELQHRISRNNLSRIRKKKNSFSKPYPSRGDILCASDLTL